MALRKTQSNIVNIGFHISTEDDRSGVQISQSIVNGQSTAVSFRTLNGARKSAAIELDISAIADLREALTEILEASEV